MYCLSVVGTQNAHNLISISTDGKLCSWSLDMLSQPQEALELHTKQSKAIAATCLAFPHGDVNNFVMGSEDGTVYSGERGDAYWYQQITMHILIKIHALADDAILPNSLPPW